MAPRPITDGHKAEIEAVAEVLAWEFGISDRPSRRIIDASEKAIATLDRVRVARGDEAVPACVREYHAMLAGDVDFLRAQRAKARADIDAARSPQDEDHEAGIEAAHNILYRQFAGPRTRDTVRRAIDAYLSRVSPSRDARGDEAARWIEPHDALKYELGDPMDDERVARSPQSEDHDQPFSGQAADDIVESQGEDHETRSFTICTRCWVVVGIDGENNLNRATTVCSHLGPFIQAKGGLGQ